MNKRGWWIVAIIVVVAIVAGYLLFSGEEPLLAPTDVKVNVGNANPQITSVTPPTAVDLTAGTTTDVTFQFNVRDPNGADDISDATTLATFTMSGETDRTGSCAVLSQGNKDKTYECTVPMQYYDKYGTWNLAVYVEDTKGASDSDSSAFDVNQLKAISIPALIDLGTVTPGATDSLSSPIALTNDGNVEAPADSAITITANDLVGVTNPAESIPAANFRASDTSGTTCASGALLSAGSGTTTDVTLPRGASATGSLSLCITQVPEISAQEYQATGGNAWQIEI